MRIALITAGLEPGRDGVGDYCRKLGFEMKRQGHDVMLISLNDHFVESQDKEAFSGVTLIRSAASKPMAQRVQRAQEVLEEFHPDWVSLQFVCYGYHPRGLAWNWNPAFSCLGKTGRFRHLMFHELWTGSPPLHRWLIGRVQQWGIWDLHRRFQPDLVTTSMANYQQRLENYCGIPAQVLPLFGNIPLATRHDNYVVKRFRAAGSRLAEQSRSTFLNGVFFGAIHSDFDAQPLIQWLKKLYSRSGKPLVLAMVGRSGAGVEPLVAQLTCSASVVSEVLLLGAQDEQLISQMLLFADFGINTGSARYLGKSGTFAAMREHGLPVVLADGELDPVILQKNAPPVLQFSNKSSVSTLLNYQRLANPNTMAATTAENLIRLFEK